MDRWKMRRREGGGDRLLRRRTGEVGRRDPETLEEVVLRRKRGDREGLWRLRGKERGAIENEEGEEGKGELERRREDRGRERMKGNER